MKATLLTRERVVYQDGSVVEMVIWQVPESVPPTAHGLKYSLVYIVGGKRVVGYDNERGKGDHRHFKGSEAPYKFESIDKLLADFVADVTMLRNPA